MRADLQKSARAYGIWKTVTYLEECTVSGRVYRTWNDPSRVCCMWIHDTGCIAVCCVLCLRQPLCEGNFVLQPQVDFEIGVETVAGLLELG